jgi:hypothetical protein
MNNRIFPTLFVSLISTASIAGSNVNSALSNYKITSELNREMASISEAEQKKREVLIDLPNKIASEFLNPSIVEGEISGEGDELTYSGEVSYRPGAGSNALVRKISLALGTPGNGSVLCLSGEDADPQRVTIDDNAVDTLLSSLGTSAAKIAPSVHFVTKAGKDTVVVASELQGEALYKELRKSLEKAGAKGSVRVYLEVPDGPKVGATQKPANLILTTTDGRKLQLEVEIDAPAKNLADNVPKGAVWRVAGSNIEVPFSKKQSGHLSMLSALLKNGKLRLSNIERNEHFPIVRNQVTGADYRIQTIGNNNAWFGQAELAVTGVMTVKCTDGRCDVDVNVSGSNSAVALGPLSEDQWSRVTSFRPVRKGKEIVDLGYLEGPACASTPQNTSFDRFDRSMTLGADCTAMCKDINIRLKAQVPLALLMGSIGHEVADTLKKFHIPECETNCKASSEYMSCMSDAVSNSAIQPIQTTDDSSGDGEEKESNLNNFYLCQSRQPYSTAPKSTDNQTDDADGSESSEESDDSEESEEVPSI